MSHVVGLQVVYCTSKVYTTLLNIKENSPLIPQESSPFPLPLPQFHLSHIALVPCTQPYFLLSVFLRCAVAFPCMKYQYFSMAALFKPALFLRYIFPPLSPISLPPLSGILQRTNCRFPQWPSLFPHVSLRDICGAHSMYVRPLNEKSNLGFLCV